MKLKICEDCGQTIPPTISGQRAVKAYCRKCGIERNLKRHRLDLARYHTLVAEKGYYVQEHRYIWEKANGKLPKGWVIHHLNGLKGDNRKENLLGMARGDHSPRLIIQALQERIRKLESDKLT